MSQGKLTWEIQKIASSLKLTEKDVIEYFTDGRRVSFILERRLAQEVMKGSLAKSEGAGYDLIDKDGNKWEVRSISNSGVYFCPSYMVGSGRSFHEEGFLKKLDEIQGYILCDITAFPNVPYWIVYSEQVRTWWNNNKLGQTTKISRSNALELLK